MASSKCSSPISRTESIYKSESSLAMSISSANKPVAVNSMKTLASQIVAYHFCQSDNAPSCLIPEFIHRFDNFYYNLYNNISSVVEFQRWWVLKSKILQCGDQVSRVSFDFLKWRSTGPQKVTKMSF